MSSQSQLPLGFLGAFSTWNRFSNVQFAIEQALAKLQTATLVKVIACTNDGGLSPVGTVDVQPCVNQVDSAGNPYPHATIFNVPYLRIQSAAGNGIILDPSPGDVGACLFASRDLSQVKSTRAPANPGSSRKYDFSDGLYIGLMLSAAAPSRYIRFAADGIHIVAPDKIFLEAPEIDLTAAAKITLQAPEIDLKGEVNQTDGTMTVETDLLAGPTSISSVNHVHTSGSPGSPTSPPTP